ncbi:MFS transporter [Knoellia sp. S7-12]|uniref:MFS transporter n=1 Tax=Knoellia sp. S7-12 TaxID=3126698 RepID=UPI003365DA7F
MSTSPAALPVETPDPTSSTAALARRLRPLQVGVALQAFVLWVPVEKLFMSGIGFTAATIGIMAAVYAATVPLLEIPSGVAADRWSRTRLMALAGVALAASTLIGGLSQGVGTYVVSAVFLGVYFAMASGTVDSVLYDTLLEATGSGETFDRWLGRIRAQESTSLVASAVLGGLVAGWLSPRATYFATVPVTLLSIVFLLRFREPQLHRSNTGTSIAEQTRHTMRAMTRGATVRNAILLGAATGMLLQAVFEFGPRWLTAVDAPAPLYGPYWAALVSTIGFGAGWRVASRGTDAARWSALPCSWQPHRSLWPSSPNS